MMAVVVATTTTFVLLSNTVVSGFSLQSARSVVLSLHHQRQPCFASGPRRLHHHQNHDSFNDKEEEEETQWTSTTPQRQAGPLWNRRNWLVKSLCGTSSMLLFCCQQDLAARAFDGGVGGLGKTKPETGVVFRNADITGDGSMSSIGRAPPTTPTFVNSGASGDVTVELLAPDGVTPVLLSFQAPWPLLKTNSGIESRDLSNPESAFVQVAPTKKGAGGGGASSLPPAFFYETVFGSLGKFGAYGPPTDIRIKKVPSSSNIYEASFTILTPAMRESERRAYIAASVVGNGVFLLICTTTAARFKKQANVLRTVASSFACVEAPKTSLRSSSPQQQ